MPSKIESTLYNIGYPVYGAKFLDESTLLVTGGGGEGNNGIPNKISALKIDFSKKKVIKRFRELTLNDNDDSPTTLDCSHNIILVGCNESCEKIKSGKGNNHLRKYVYQNEHLKFVASIDLDGSTKPEDYTKLTYLSPDGTVAAIASSKVPTIIRIVNPVNLRETYEVETGNDVKDLHFSPDGKVLSYITASTLEVMSIVTGNFIVRKTDFDRNWSLSKIRFIDQDNVVIAATFKKGSGVVLIKISLKSAVAKIVRHKVVTNKFKGVTSMDVDQTGELVALAGNENSVVIITLRNFSVVKFVKQVHNFAITKIVFSPQSNLLASVSAANTVHVMKFPKNLGSSPTILESLMKFITNVVLIVLLAGFAHYARKHDFYRKAFNFAHTRYLKLTETSDSSQYFVLHDYPSQTTLLGDTEYHETVSSSLSTLVESTVGPNETSADDFISEAAFSEVTETYTKTAEQMTQETTVEASGEMNEEMTEQETENEQKADQTMEVATEEATEDETEEKVEGDTEEETEEQIEQKIEKATETLRALSGEQADLIAKSEDNEVTKNLSSPESDDDSTQEEALNESNKIIYEDSTQKNRGFKNDTVDQSYSVEHHIAKEKLNTQKSMEKLHYHSEEHVDDTVTLIVEENKNSPRAEMTNLETNFLTNSTHDDGTFIQESFSHEKTDNVVEQVEEENSYFNLNENNTGMKTERENLTENSFQKIPEGTKSSNPNQPTSDEIMRVDALLYTEALESSALKDEIPIEYDDSYEASEAMDYSIEHDVLFIASTEDDEPITTDLAVLEELEEEVKMVTALLRDTDEDFKDEESKSLSGQSSDYVINNQYISVSDLGTQSETTVSTFTSSDAQELYNSIAVEKEVTNPITKAQLTSETGTRKEQEVQSDNIDDSTTAFRSESNPSENIYSSSTEKVIIVTTVTDYIEASSFEDGESNLFVEVTNIDDIEDELYQHELKKNDKF